MRVLLRHLLEALVRDDADRAVGDADHVVLKRLERKGMQVGEVAGDVNFHDLPLAGRQVLRPNEPTVEEEQA